MKVREVMTAWPVTVAPEHSLGEAVEEMLRRRVRSLPVVEEGRVVGILTDRDVRVALGHDAVDLDLATMHGDALKDPVRRWMTEGAATIGPEEPVSVACRALATARIGALPVVDEEGEMVGIVSTSDLLQAAADVFDDLA
jgi:acetoin utilization protein AcuB